MRRDSRAAVELHAVRRGDTAAGGGYFGGGQGGQGSFSAPAAGNGQAVISYNTAPVTTTTLSSSANPSVIGQRSPTPPRSARHRAATRSASPTTARPSPGAPRYRYREARPPAQATPASGADTIAATFTGSVGFGGSTGTLTQYAVLPPCVPFVPC